MSTFAAARPRTTLATRWQWGRMTELAVGDLYAVMVARQEVFAVEQGCAFLDADRLDANAFHLLGWVRTVSAPFHEDGIAHLEMLHPVQAPTRVARR